MSDTILFFVGLISSGVAGLGVFFVVKAGEASQADDADAASTPDAETSGARLERRADAA